MLQVCTSRREAVKKYTPETECKKVPRQLCGPSGCVPEAGPEECFDRKATIVQEVRKMKSLHASRRAFVSFKPEVLVVKQESRNLGQRSNPVSGSRKSKTSSPRAKQHSV